MTKDDAGKKLSIQGPIETFVRNGKKKNAADLAHLLDSELVLLHNEMVRQEQDLKNLQNLLAAIEGKYTNLGNEIRSLRVLTTQMEEKIISLAKKYERQEPFIMRLGTIEIPVEFTGIVGGILAFVIAVLVALDQKAVMLSPIFLSAVGFLLIGVAMAKTVRTRTRFTQRQPNPEKHLTVSSVKIISPKPEQKDG